MRLKHMLGTGAVLMLASVATLGIAIASAPPASAHVVRPVGRYVFTVGWANEPTYTGSPNAVYLGVKLNGQPVDDIGNDLKVTVSTANQTSPPLEPELSFDSDTGLGTHGVFNAFIIPTVPGVYTFHFTGSVNGQSVDQSFTSSDSTFDDVVDPTGVEFPAKVPSGNEISTRVARLGPRVAAATSKASSASDSASTAKTLGIVALIVGIVLGGGGILVGLSGRRPSKS